ncbi:mechanosensitive ion channel [Lentisphaera profundi]|uniref:Mechanosensitive ion channel n=1 Tax=Lentisphaera profundi TaxID=1658616 RepID=A0ABY7VZ01_9BACT|nr:mechanosensitive ion channel domain-containing protein [Lentisphaera profundi]WDE99420.1 mechanosensitive ion channel [Lentisphaera profundi]
MTESSILDWLSKFFGHTPLSGVDSFIIHFIRALFVVGLFVIIGRILPRIVEKHLKTNKQADEVSIKIYIKFISYLLWAIGTTVTVHTLGLDLSSVFTTSGLFAVALGFSLKSTMENYAAGAMLRFEGSIKHGDILDVKGIMVKVKSVGLRDTIVRSKNDKDILIPNALLVENSVGNYTLRDSICRLETSLGVSYDSDLKKVRDVLEKSCVSLDGFISAPKAQILLKEFGSSSVNYAIYMWTDNPWAEPKLTSILNEAIWWGLKDADITIAFPQMDIHFDEKPTANIT